MDIEWVQQRPLPAMAFPFFSQPFSPVFSSPEPDGRPSGTRTKGRGATEGPRGGEEEVVEDEEERGRGERKRKKSRQRDEGNAA